MTFASFSLTVIVVLGMFWLAYEVWRAIDFVAMLGDEDEHATMNGPGLPHHRRKK